MRVRWLGVAFALALLACGSEFTAGPVDGGSDGPSGSGGIDASSDGPGEPPEAGSGHDAEAPHDASSPEDSGGVTGSEGGAMGDGGGLCARTCPSGFACELGKCVDHVRTHFSSTPAGWGNWEFGSFMPQTAMIAVYSVFSTTYGVATANGLEYWTGKTAPPGVFYNPTLSPVPFQGMTVPAGIVGALPSDTRASGATWTAPAGPWSYSVTATFTGLGNGPPTTVGVVVLEGPEEFFSQTLNAYGTMNNAVTFDTATDSPPAPIAEGTQMSFIVQFLQGLDGGLLSDAQGGTSLEITITAN